MKQGGRSRSLLLLALLACAPQFSCWAAQSSDDLFSGAQGFGEEIEFLPVDEAFRPSAKFEGDEILVHWVIHEGYYLYRHRLKFDSADPGLLAEPAVPPGHEKEDEYFGRVEVYYGELAVTIPVVWPPERRDRRLLLTIEYQGCADAGLCYPPTRKQFALTRGDNAIMWPVAAHPGAATVAADPVPAGEPLTEGSRMAETLASGSLALVLLLFFGAGIGLAFTPCVLPMVPILSSIIVGRRELPSRWSAFSLSLTYVLGMAVTYALLGTLVGYFGAEFNLQASLQSAPVLILFALLFVALSLAMFGVYELQLPGPLRDRLSNLSAQSEGGEYVGVATMGVISSLVVSPCVSAPLAGALVYISTTGDALLGGVALLALGLGMGVPLLVIGTSGGELLPRAGSWMNLVKLLFGVMLLGVAVWLLERILPPVATMLLWSALALGLGVTLVVPRFAREFGGGKRARALGVVVLAYGGLLLVGGAAGGEDPVKPWRGLFGGDEGIRFERVANLTDVEARLTTTRLERRPLILDFYADWCVSCKVMEREVFNHPEVRPLMERFRLLQIDVTDNTREDQAVLNRYGLFGPPAILLFDRDGRELRSLRIQGEVGWEQFRGLLDRAWKG